MLQSLTRSGTSGLVWYMLQNHGLIRVLQLVVLEPGLFRTSAVSNCIIEPPLPAYASNPSLPTMKYRALYPNIDKTHFNGDPMKFADLVCRLVRMENLPSFIRLPVHRVALASARKKGEMLVEAAEKLAEWSDDLYLDELE